MRPAANQLALIVLSLAAASTFLLTNGLARAGDDIVGWGDTGRFTVQDSEMPLTAISAGQVHNLGLQADGSVVAWGGNDWGQCDVPSPNAGFVSIAAGAYHNLGIRDNGVIVVWGTIDASMGNVPMPNSGYVAVSAGGAHNLALRENGSIEAFGDRSKGQCNVPAPNSDFVAVAAGLWHSIGLKSDGSIVAWGLNTSGQCIVPVPNSDFVAISANGNHNMALRANGSIVAWGDRAYLPVPNADFQMVAAGEFQNLALKTDGSIVAWGSSSDVPSPNAGFAAIASGGWHSAALKDDGTVVAWGVAAGQGQLIAPKAVGGFAAVCRGTYGNCLGLRSNGSLVDFGTLFDGELPSPNLGYVAVSGGAAFYLALNVNGFISAWGDNSIGQCNVPSPNSDFAAVAAGQFHCLGLKADGTITSWGFNHWGQCTVPTPNADFVAVAACEDHSLGLKSDGAIRFWGNNDWGQCDEPANNAGFVAIAAGKYHNLGLKADGSIVGRGQNDKGQCNVPPPNADFIAIAAGDEHSLGLKANGTIVAWGDNSYGQCNIPLPNSGFIAVAAGYYTSLGIRRYEPTAWYGLYQPHGLVTDVGVATDPALGRVWIHNVTDQPGLTPGLTAQLGYGPDGSSPANGGDAWCWIPAEYVGDQFGSDEFNARMTVIAPGEYDYAYRYSLNNGSWLYADLDGAANGYLSSQAGSLVVNEGPLVLTRVGGVLTADIAFDLSLVGAHAYVAARSAGLQVVDVQSPAAPQIVGSIDTPGFAVGVEVVGDFAYVADYHSGLQVIDISNPYAPELVSSIIGWGPVLGLCVSGDFAYIVGDGEMGLGVVSILNPQSPALVGASAEIGQFDEVAVYGNRAYVVDRLNGLLVFDISDPLNPQKVGEALMGPQWGADSIEFSDAKAYVTGAFGIQVFDVSGLNPQLLSEFPGVDSRGLDIVGNYAFVARGTGELAIVSIANPLALEEVASMHVLSFPFAVRVRGVYVYICQGVGLGVVLVQGANVASVPGPEDLTVIRAANFPNPFNPSTTIHYTLPKSGQVGLRIYDLRGRLVKVLVDEYLADGRHEVLWDGTDNCGQHVASGAYIYRLNAGGQRDSGRMMLVK